MYETKEIHGRYYSACMNIVRFYDYLEPITYSRLISVILLHLQIYSLVINLDNP